MKRYRLHLVSLVSLALAVAFLTPQRAVADDDDPPSRVARLGFVRGTVSFEPAGTEDWVSAVLNRPLTTGDKIWNDDESVSELHLGSAAIRLGSDTGFSFLNLTDNVAQLRLTEGTLNIRVRRLGDDETFEVDTPNLAFTVLRPGNYKISVNEAGDTTIVLVRDGQGEVTGGGSAYTLHPTDIGTFTGTDEVDADIESWDNSADDFDDWSAERDLRWDHSISNRYVSDDVIGYEDLDENGGWRPTPDYGTVWFPHVAIVGWAPYHYGHWAYVAPWGYTWVDDASWGFAPFHYGRWVTVGGVWGWVPAPPRPVAVVGVVYVRPVYAPALVAWVGGPGFGIGVGLNVGWFPLGPREVYAPSYPVSRNYWTNINVSNTRVETTVVNNYYTTVVVNKTVINNVTYTNQRVTGAVMVTTPAAFSNAQPVARNVVAVNVNVVAHASVGFAAPAVAPSRTAVLGAGVAVSVRPRVAFEARAVVAKTAPPPPPPSFAKQQQAIQANGGRPIAVAQMRQIEPANTQVHANIKIAPPAKPQAVQVHGVQPNPNRPANTNKPANPPVANANAKTNPNVNTNTNRPPASKPSAPAAAAPANPELDQKHQQQVQDLRAKQDAERQKVEQQQQADRAALEKKKADDAKQQQLNQQHQKQLEDLEKKHDSEEAQLKQKQQEEKKAAQKPAKPAKDDKPPKKDQ
ncbi:MAG TPA: DUF6600 domain-containing protein [Candidatus Acidoferrum sp.]|nr:DUF6600 domain-containing protein [Candidatus Acidoferrum sp.]